MFAAKDVCQMKEQGKEACIYTSGQMAEMNGISRKALRLYQEKGVFEPTYVEKQSGYRYYTLEQVAQLDLIQKLQSIGLSLQQISEVFQSKDINALELRMLQQTSELDRQIAKLQLARNAAAWLAESCNLVKNKPPCNQLTVEWMPRQRLLRFPVTPYDYASFHNVQREGFYHWEMALREVKHKMQERDLPMCLFNNVGCFADMEALKENRLVITAAGVHVPPEFSREDCEYAVLPAGLYITAYCDGTGDTPSFSQEACLVQQMLDEIRKNDWQIAGDYYGDVLADTPAFHYRARENFMRLRIPVTGVHKTGSNDYL